MIFKAVFPVLFLAVSLALTTRGETLKQLSIEQLQERGLEQPYAPELFERNQLSWESMNDGTSFQARDIDAEDIKKRSIFKRTLESLSGSKASMEKLEARSRKSCHNDYQCPGDQYCSTKRNQCFKKIASGSHCGRDYACQSGYCSNSGRCQTTKQNGSKCKYDISCASSYCSPVSNTCRSKQPKGGKCVSSAGCKDHLKCYNKKCTEKHKHHHPKPPKHPKPSGSHWHPRELKQEQP